MKAKFNAALYASPKQCYNLKHHTLGLPSKTSVKIRQTERTRADISMGYFYDDLYVPRVVKI